MGSSTPTVASRRLASEVFLTENSVCVFAIAILAALRARRATSTSKRAYVKARRLLQRLDNVSQLLIGALFAESSQ